MTFAYVFARIHSTITKEVINDRAECVQNKLYEKLNKSFIFNTLLRKFAVFSRKIEVKERATIFALHLHFLTS